MTSKTHKKRKRASIEKNNMEDGIHILAKSIRQRFEELPPLSSKCCIYRVPRTLRNANVSAYKPCLISIGPFNYGIKRLQGMQEQKLRYLQNFLRRNERKTLKDYLRALKELENNARECYIDRISLSSDEFVEMMLLDGCFIIEFFMNWYSETSDEDDRIFGKPSLEHVIRRDLLLIENQLPYFVLQGLYNLAFEDEEGDDDGDDDDDDGDDNDDDDDDDDDDSCKSSIPFDDLTSEVLIGKRKLPAKFDKREILHLVDFLRTWLLPKDLRDPNYVPSKNDACWEFTPGAGDLHDAGVKFVACKSDSLLDIEFIDGVLYIPKIEVEDQTESILLNLSAFEQCHYHYDSYIVDYVIFMDVLITTIKDVDILLSSGIVTNALGNNEEVAHLFNTICRETNYEAHKFYYSDICRRLVAHSKARWNRWKATLKHDYFNNPWTIISVVAAIVLLILTVVQTACCIISARRS